MFEDKRASRLRVALAADLILLGCGPEHLLPEGAVRVVTVGAFHQAFVDLVMERHVELRFLLRVALEAKRRLRGLQ